MSRFKIFIPKLFLLSVLFCHPASGQQPEVKEEIYKMLAACDRLKTASFNLVTEERLKNGKWNRSEILIKLQRKPKNIYIYCINPNPGAECLWREGEMNNQLLVNPNGFPYFNLRLRTHHSLLRKGQHHTVEEVGFDYITEVLRYYIEKEGEKIFDFFRLNGTTEYDGRLCKVLQYENPSFAYVNYTVKDGENLTAIAKAHYVSDYMLMEVNDLKNYDSVKPGQVIKLPVTYGKKIVFYVDARNNLPLVQIIYDDHDLYEKYEFESFVLNPNLNSDDFSPENPKYGF